MSGRRRRPRGAGGEAQRGCGAHTGAVRTASVMGRRGLRFRRMERRCAGVVNAAGVAGGEMGEDSLDDVGGLDARDDAQCAATHATVFDVDVEDSLEPLHRAHGRWTRRMRLARERRLAFGAPLGWLCPRRNIGTTRGTQTQPPHAPKTLPLISWILFPSSAVGTRKGTANAAPNILSFSPHFSPGCERGRGDVCIRKANASHGAQAYP